MRRSVFFAIPAYDGKVCAEFLLAFAETMRLIDRIGLHAQYRILPGDCYIHKARNTLTADFLDSSATEMFFLDTDLGWNPDDVLRMLQLPHELAVAVYPFKQDAEAYPITLEAAPESKPVFDAKTGCYSIVTGPTGFMRIRRSVFDRLAPIVGSYSLAGRRFGNYFATPVEDETFFGEDVFFIQQWLRAGGRAWCLPNVQFRHVGAKAWQGDFHAWTLKGNSPPGMPHPCGHLSLVRSAA